MVGGAESGEREDELRLRDQEPVAVLYCDEISGRGSDQVLSQDSQSQLL